MTKEATKKAGNLPNAAIDFAKVHENAKAGAENIYDGATSKVRETDPKKIARAEAKAREAAEEAGEAPARPAAERTAPARDEK
jgi:hypothetical protein